MSNPNHYGFNPKPRYPSSLSDAQIIKLRQLGRKAAKPEEMSAVMAAMGVLPDGEPPTEHQLRNWCTKLNIPFSAGRPRGRKPGYSPLKLKAEAEAAAAAAAAAKDHANDGNAGDAEGR